jgi:hypothetical protein
MPRTRYTFPADHARAIACEPARLRNVHELHVYPWTLASAVLTYGPTGNPAGDRY